MFAKCIDHQNKVAKKAPVCEPVMKQVVERDTTQKIIDALFAAFPGANVGPPPVPLQIHYTKFVLMNQLRMVFKMDYEATSMPVLNRHLFHLQIQRLIKVMMN